MIPPLVSNDTAHTGRHDTMSPRHVESPVGQPLIYGHRSTRCAAEGVSITGFKVLYWVM